jgi:peptidyl-dipeptidase Dcp
MDFRVGFGYDSHRFAPNRPLVLGGICVPYEKGLAAHSDGDVLIHALCDALLGAAALKDIGTHFPDNDATYQNADSKELLAKVVKMLYLKGWLVNNVDCTLILEQPKMRPYIDPMTETLAPILRVETDRVSIKAKTNEKMGFTGNGEGIAATVVASIVQNGNPFVLEWNTPHQTPPFDKIKPEHYIPAFEFGIEQAKAAIKDIKNNPEEPTFQNTIVALDRTGKVLNKVAGVFFNLLECDSTDEMQAIANEVQPMLTLHSNSVYLDETLFARVKAVYEREYAQLQGAEKMLMGKTFNAFLDNGANLAPEQKDIFNKVSVELSNLTLAFGNNALAATNSWHKLVADKEELQGLPDNELAIAAQRAEARGEKGYVFDLSAPSVNAILKYADNRELRKEMFLHSCNKAYGGEFDNCENIQKILQCREQLARLLSYDNYAQYALHDRMAKDCAHVYHLLDQLREASLPAARRELAALNEYAHSLGFEGNLQRWDFAYYTEKQQKVLFNLSTEELKPYFKLENVIDGVFALAEKLYDLRFVPTSRIARYHPDVKVYEVHRKEQFMSVLYLDFHPRATKRSGAWMTSFREQYVDENQQDVRPLVSLVMNFTPSTPDNPSLLSFNEVTTFLHEFGHALNGMLSEVPYQTISGTNSPRDFVELPSQLNENWATEPEFLQMFARHYQSGELIPMHYIEQLKKMRQFMAGYACVRQLSFGYLDMMYHTTPAADILDIHAKEREIFDPLDVLPVVPEACMSSSFGHIFAGGYAAGYYGYKWAEMLEADAFSMFQEEGVMNKDTANRYLDCILSKGGSIPADEMFRQFRGREPEIQALLKRDGLVNG